MKEEIEMSYMAGVMDGDGSFSLSKRSNGDLSPLYFPLIQMGNVCRKLVERFQEKFGGSIVTRKPYEGKDGSKRQECFTWKIDKLKSIQPIRDLMPYLVIKRDRAKFLLEYMEKNPFVRGSRRLSQEVLDTREKSYIRMMTLNRDAFLTEDLKIEQAKVPSSDEKFWSYIAGLMDTDGSFSINRCRFSPSILLSMTDTRAINFLKNGCPWGNFCYIKANSCLKGACYRFSISSRLEAIFFLKKILPYLYVKNQVAECLLEYCESFISTQHRRLGVGDEELDRRRCYFEKIKYLNANQHGVYKPSLIDLEVLDEDDRAQAGCEAVQGERLSVMDSKECATV